MFSYYRTRHFCLYLELFLCILNCISCLLICAMIQFSTPTTLIAAHLPLESQRPTTSAPYARVGSSNQRRTAHALHSHSQYRLAMRARDFSLTLANDRDRTRHGAAVQCYCKTQGRPQRSVTRFRGTRRKTAASAYRQCRRGDSARRRAAQITLHGAKGDTHARPQSAHADWQQHTVSHVVSQSYSVDAECRARKAAHRWAAHTRPAASVPKGPPLK